MFRSWAIFAAPWLIGVLALSIYDHKRAILRFFLDAEQFGGSALVHWLRALAEYAGPPVMFYGVLPTSLTFFLFVVFLPWADRWSSQGSLEE